MNNDLASRVTFRLEENGIHVDAWLQATCLGLYRLCPADLAAPGTDGSIVRHVLRFEGRDADTGAREGAAEGRHDDTLADVGRGSHYHQGLASHQNWMPFSAGLCSSLG